MSRPTFDPAVYESAELAELNRPLHNLGWDLIEADKALNELSLRRAPRAEWEAQFAIATAARKAHNDAMAELDRLVEEYCERIDAALQDEDSGDATNQIEMGL